MKKNNKGFSLVELLAVVVILGLLSAIGIGVTANLVDKAKKDKMDSQKNTITLSAQSYLQNNKNLVPKIIGESKIIRVSELRAANYLTEDIKNNNGESCMEKSYVRVYKLSNTEYTYTTFLYCGNEEIPAEQDVPTPKVVAKFSDSTGEIKDENLNNVSDAYLYIELNAATEEEIQEYKNNGTQIAVDGYSFSIFITKNGQKNEVYNSGSLSGGREQKIIINKKLNEYINVTDITEISLEVIAINTVGGVTNTNTTIGEHGEVSSTEYEDTIPPVCVKPDNPYSEGDWVNKNEYNKTKLARKLTVGCDDGTGSGCIRNYFTMSWPNDDAKYGAEYVYIQVKDNAGNVSERNEACRFRVNVDLQSPSITVNAYSSQPSTATTIPMVSINPNLGFTTQGVVTNPGGVGLNALPGGTSGDGVGQRPSTGFAPTNPTHILANKIANKPSILSKSVTVNNKTTTATISTTDYKSLTSNKGTVKWMNKENYPDGVVYRIDLDDNLRLDKWTWQTNPGYVNDTNSKSYKSVSLKNPESSSGVIAQDAAHGQTLLSGSTHETIFVEFKTEGMRYGVFTVYDKSGNSSEIIIKANLDRTAPPVPNNLVAYVYNKVRDAGTSVSNDKYSFGSWTNRYVQVQTAPGLNNDKASNGTSLSGFWEFRYEALNNAGQRVGTNPYKTYTSGKGLYDFKGTAAQVDGKNKIRFMSCDIAGNCSQWGNYKNVWIDITVPVCSVEKVLNGTESTYGWLGAGETAVVRATCSDPTPTTASGCTKESFEKLYNSQIITTMAGAKDNGIGGSFEDAAGNKVDCPANKTVKIDYSYPTCSVSGGSNKWTNGSRTVTGKCSDTGGSGCVGNISYTYSSDIETTTAGAKGNNKGGSIKDKADNETNCPANQTVKVDKTMPYVTVDIQPGTFEDNDGFDVTITCHDSLSGLSSTFDKSYTGKMFAPTNGTYIAKCCEDNAGNSMCDDRGPYKIKIFGPHEDCGEKSYFMCRTTLCGVELYLNCEHAHCGVKSYNYCAHSDCGSYKMYKYDGILTCPGKDGTRISKNVFSGYNYSASSSAHAACESLSWSACKGVIHYICTTPSKTYYNSCRTSGCGVEHYKTCRTEGCGVELYRKCKHPVCGVKEHKSCWHFGYNCDCSKHKVKTY
ncbi:MAG: type II secretion system protein [Bacilli bacterium]|nr:type II secretion system protein [Bacilli bacterium]